MFRSVPLLERDRAGVAAVVGALRGHVEHVLDAVDLLLDRRGDRSARRPGAGARGSCSRLDRGRRDRRVLRDRQRRHRQPPASVMNDRQHGGEDRPVDEEPGDHRQQSAVGRISGRRGSKVAERRADLDSPMTNHSSSVRHRRRSERASPYSGRRHRLGRLRVHLRPGSDPQEPIHDHPVAGLEDAVLDHPERAELRAQPDVPPFDLVAIVHDEDDTSGPGRCRSPSRERAGPVAACRSAAGRE